MWASKEAVNDWHMDTYHKHAKEWAANGAIMEDIITNFESRRPGCCASARPAARCRTRPTTWRPSRRRLAEPCPKCGFHFPVAQETANSTAVFKDVI